MDKPAISIQAQGLGRTFFVARKSEGILASIKNLISPVYDEIQAVKNFDLTIQEGEMGGFLGPNGAGKTTTLKMFSGLIPIVLLSAWLAVERVDGNP